MRALTSYLLNQHVIYVTFSIGGNPVEPAKANRPKYFDLIVNLSFTIFVCELNTLASDVYLMQCVLTNYPFNLRIIYIIFSIGGNLVELMKADLTS